MKFKLVEQTIDNTRAYVQEYMYDAMDELNNASLEEYIQWFKSELTSYDDDVEQAVTDAYIEACDYGMIKGVEKTRLTSELKEYIESHTDIIDDTDELMRQCPGHLQHELKIVLSKLDESLTESALEEALRPDLKRFIEQHAELLDESNIEELYKQCPRELKIPLIRMLNAASLGDNIESIKKATFLADFYDDEELINLVLSIGEHANDVFDAFDYIMNNWDEFFTDDMLNKGLLTEATRAPKRIIYEARFDTPNENDAIEIFSDDYEKFKELLDKYRRHIKTATNIKVHLLKFVKKTYKFPDIKASFTVSDANQLDSHVHQSFRKSIDDNKVDISNNKQERLLAIWERNYYTDGKIEPVDKYHSKITFE